jgi:hypothetical protein
MARKAGIHNIHFINADILTVPLDRSFDIVLCLNRLHHMETIERVDVLLRKLYAFSGQKLVLIAPISDDPVLSYECVIRDGVREFLIYARYLQQIYGSEAVEFKSLDRRCYGPGRALFIIWRGSKVG